ncbi:G1/S-specific cyclin-D2-like [Lutzomyia longipalpis]|uniref:Putative g1/s-specific cyclin d n=1 Tax=Lutzomyia longipalpis TaxID=7200 RepID=A0A1B0CE04_LUTLO|nr:G1/S-specific cyclin-D2-like [Lutzomyia longipalpis]XP_055682744.1 G1/S-specific cyclin-D2-like [Lutzomyia longipalpis]XP_055682745.1 G1/S-specific cyclin-D2-like [Lutzomyia longipalpis]
MDLRCDEVVGGRIDSNFAQIDPTMSRDPRVLQNLLQLECTTIPNMDYFKTFQTDLKPFMRKFVAIWMLELCDEQHCEEQVFPLAINFLDRFLCVCNISRQQLQLLGATCLLLASKVRQCLPLPVDLLCAYTDHTVTPDQIRNWELLVLASLQWNLSAITGFDYIDHILQRVPWGSENPHIRTHAHTLVSVCLTELVFMRTPPSVLAAACICAATRGINSPSARLALGDLVRLTRVDPVEVEISVRHIEAIVAKQAAAMQKQQQITLKAQYPVLPAKCAIEVYQTESGSDFQGVGYY